MASSVFGFFGLHENPFSINPNPRFLYLTPLTQAASYQLLEGVRDRKGLILLTGEVGTGKTLLLRRLLDWLTEQKMPTAMIFNSHVNPDHLLDFILSDFGVRCDSSFKSDKLIALNNWLLDRFRTGQTPVLIIDEAQGLPLHALEEVRLLLNLETPRQKLLQVILAGQPELEEKLRRHDLRQLRQRITVRCRTAPLTVQETQAYIQSRLRTAGAQEPIFQPHAAAAVHAYARGIPRVINLLCEHALINACAESSHVVSPEFVERAAHDCQLDQIESVSRVLHSHPTARAASDDVSSIFAGLSFPGSASAANDGNGGRDSAALVSSNSDDSEIAATVNGSSANSVVTALADPLHALSDPFASVDAPTLEERHAALTPSIRQENGAYDQRVLSRETTQAWHSGAPARRAAPGARAGISTGTLSLFRSWWSSFSADVRSTARQIHSKLRKQALELRPYARTFANSFSSLYLRTLHFVSDPRVRAWRDHFLATIHHAYNKIDTQARTSLNQLRSFKMSRPQAAPSAQRSSPDGASIEHRPKIAKLRRWLRQPLASQKQPRNSSPHQRNVRH